MIKDGDVVILVPYDNPDDDYGGWAKYTSVASKVDFKNNSIFLTRSDGITSFASIKDSSYFIRIFSETFQKLNKL